MESKVAMGLECVIHENSKGIVSMPSYDGHLVRHEIGSFSVVDVSGPWTVHCRDTWGFEFPIVAKDWVDDVPKWLLGLLASERVVVGPSRAVRTADLASDVRVARMRFETWHKGPRSGRGRAPDPTRSLVGCVCRSDGVGCLVSLPCEACQKAYDWFSRRKA
jgi:hypothetical protein